MYAVKLALAVALCGGIERVDEGGETRVRGEPHMLLVGDPGTGKSQVSFSLNKKWDKIFLEYSNYFTSVFLPIVSESATSVAKVRRQAGPSLGAHDGRGFHERRADRVGGARRRRVALGSRCARARRRRSLLHR